MTTIALEINDAELTVAGPDGVLAVEPGYALVDDGTIVTGRAAHAKAHLKPREVSNRFWSDLRLEAGTAGIEGRHSSAELAFAQMRDLWKRFEGAAKNVLLVVPGHYDKNQLGILLGLAQECRMPVRGMIDVAAAATTRPYPGRQLVYVDASLHSLTVTPLRQDRDVVALEQKTLATAGLVALDDVFAKRLAKVFVLTTRFDAFHDAASEQVLYDNLPRWLEQLRAAPKVQLTLPLGREEQRAEVERSYLVAAAAGIYRALLQFIAQAREPGSALAVQLSDRLARQLGLREELARLDDAIVIAHEPARPAQGALAALATLASGDQVKLLRRLAWRGASLDAETATTAPPPSEPVVAPAARPTHVVYRGVAYAVDGKGLIIGREGSDNRRAIVIDDQSSGISRSHCEIALSHGELVVRDLSSYGTFVNEKRVSGEEVLHPADVIRIGSPGAELELIRVEP